MLLTIQFRGLAMVYSGTGSQIFFNAYFSSLWILRVGNEVSTI